MVSCSRRKVKSTLGRGRRGGGLTGGAVGATVALAVVTTSCAGTSRLWPTAVSLLAPASARPTASSLQEDEWPGSTMPGAALSLSASTGEAALVTVSL